MGYFNETHCQHCYSEFFYSSYETTDYVKQRIQRAKKKKKSPILYMDDLKLIAKSEEELRKQVQAFKNLAMIFKWNVE